MLNLVPDEEKKRICRFKNWQDAQSTFIGRLLIRSMISHMYSLKDFSFHVNEYGKPYILELPDIHFNISHSGKWVVCALDKKPLGIDIEKIQPIDLNIAKEFFSIKEYENLLKREKKDRLSYFFDLWTLKESYIKSEGNGLSIPLNSFTINKENGSINMTGGVNYYYFKQYNISDEYKLSVASKSNNFPIKPICFSVNTFFEFVTTAL